MFATVAVKGSPICQELVEPLTVPNTASLFISVPVKTVTITTLNLRQNRLHSR